MKRPKQFLAFYHTKEHSSNTWVTARDKFEARAKTKRKGRKHIRIYRNVKDVERAYQNKRIGKDDAENIIRLITVDAARKAGQNEDEIVKSVDKALEPIVQ